MERIKREILQAVTTGVTACTGTTGSCYVIIPDTDATYHLIVGLTQDTRDIGFMDAFVNTLYPYGEDGEPIGLENLNEEDDGGFSGEIEEEQVSIPTVKTGTADISGSSPKKTVTGSKVETGGVITEYGIIFTQDTSFNSSSTLTYDNYINESTVAGNKKTTPETAPFDIQGFIAGIDALVYYRAFAKNSAGIGYGEVKSVYVSSELMPLT